MERRDFFVSYNNLNKPWAVWIARVLNENGYSTYSQWDIKPGESFLTKMNDFIEHSANFIAVWSEDYSNSGYCMMEWEAAVNALQKGLMGCLLPVKIDNSPVKPLYSVLVRVDLSDMSVASEAKLMDEVRRSVPHPAHERETPTPEKPLDSKSSKFISGKARKSAPTDTEILTGFIVSSLICIVLISVLVSSIWRTVTRQVDISQTREYYEQEVAQGNVEALYNLGLLYQNGLDGDTDYAKAREYYEQAVEKGNAAALYNLGVLYYYGLGVDIDYEKALNYYRQSADAGYALASEKIAELGEKLNG